MFFKYGLLLFVVIVIVLVNALTDEEQFVEFKKKYEKVYGSPEEEKNRFRIFKGNLRFMEEHNKKYSKGEATYIIGINQFADISPDEWTRINHGLKLAPVR